MGMECLLRHTRVAKEPYRALIFDTGLARELHLSEPATKDKKIP